MIVRPACADDAEAIARLSAELGYAAAPEDTVSRLTALLADERQLVVVAEDDGNVVGWLQATAGLVLESGFRVEIVGLVVAAAARRRGVGRELVQRAETWAVGVGARVLVVRSNIARTESHRFYPALGFTAAKTQHVYRRILPAASA